VHWSRYCSSPEQRQQARAPAPAWECRTDLQTLLALVLLLALVQRWAAWLQQELSWV